MTESIQPVILCGGSGSRLWPLSRTEFPKQFICLAGNESLFQQATRRLDALRTSYPSLAAPLIVTNEEHRFLVQEQLREIGVGLGRVLLEPIGRDTAPALTMAALAAMESEQDPILVVIPSDQILADTEAFQNAMCCAIKQAILGCIVILGVTPTRPETGYGYVQVRIGEEVSEVLRFVEKPDADTARRYLAEGGYFWNAGMFVLRASVWLNALKRFRPDIADASEQAWLRRTHDSVFIRPGKEAFADIPAQSIDYAVAEHCPGSAQMLSMVPLDAGWSDLGAWDSVWDVSPKDAAGNACFGDVLSVDTSNTLVHATSRLVGVAGVENLVVVETPDAVLVADKSCSQDVKRIVSTLGQQGREEHAMHRKVHRPWGWYDNIDHGDRFKVKRIQVNPGASLSLQKHHHRAEHWVVVRGTAQVTCGDQTILLTENQSTYIPLGQVHRLSNPGKLPLEIIEIQSGSYLGEDDIVRLEDHYGRTQA